MLLSRAGSTKCSAMKMQPSTKETMTTTITVNLTIIRARHDRRGDALGNPIVVVEKRSFDTDAQADNYHNEMVLWVQEMPEPSSELNHFPRRKIYPTMDGLFTILDKMHGPDDLWAIRQTVDLNEGLDVPDFMQPVNTDDLAHPEGMTALWDTDH